VKRRCAGCHAVIDGRPNRLYCSERCEQRMAKRRQRNLDNLSRDSGPVPSLIYGSNGQLIAKVARLGYLGGSDTPVLDVTYGRGKFWTLYRPANLYAPAGHDFTQMVDYDTTFPVVVFDPPYISTGNRATSTIDDFYDRYGLGETNLAGWKAIRGLIERGLTEMARLLADNGFLLVKCMDYVESGRKVWNTFHVAAYAQDQLHLRLVDRFHHVTGGGAQPLTNPDGTPREQKTAREVSSMLLVFTR